MVVSIVFVTYNRSDLLYQAISAAKNLSSPVHIIVMDDASTDGTEEMVKLNFPDVDYNRSDTNFGPSYQRNRGAEKAVSDIIFFFDDDTVITDHHTIEKTMACFTEEKVGVVAIPFINILQNKTVHNAAPTHNGTYIFHAFIAAAFAVRKDLFLMLGGFREDYFYMGEEGDFCIRLLERGYYVKGGYSIPAFHYQPANRISFSADYFGRRNDILFSFLNSPSNLLIINILIKIASGVMFGIKVKRLQNMLKGLLAGVKAITIKNTNQRKPVKYSVYKKFMFLKEHEPVLYQEIAD